MRGRGQGIVGRGVGGGIVGRGVHGGIVGRGGGRSIVGGKRGSVHGTVRMRLEGNGPFYIYLFLKKNNAVKLKYCVQKKNERGIISTVCFDRSWTRAYTSAESGS